MNSKTQRRNETLEAQFVFLAFSTIKEWHILLFVVIFLIYLAILLENLALVVIIIMDSHLHLPMYFFLWSMTILDFGNTLVVMPRFIFSLVTKSNRISFAGCAVQMFFFSLTGNATIFLVVIMAYDRYVAISNPLRYRIIISDLACLKILLLALTVSFMVAVGQTVAIFSLPFCESHEINHFFCDIAQVLILLFNCTPRFNVYEAVFNMLGVLLFNIPLLCITISYIYIVVAILRMRTTEGRRKAFSSCSSHLFTVLFQYTCLMVIYLRPKSSYLWDRNRLFAVVFMFISAMSNPVIYCLRNKAVQSAFRNAISRNRHWFG